MILAICPECNKKILSKDELDELTEWDPHDPSKGWLSCPCGHEYEVKDDTF